MAILLIASSTFALAESQSVLPTPPVIVYSKSDLPKFRTFFSNSTTITAKEVEDQFGRPSRYAPLMLNETEKDVTRDHSWWYYWLAEDENVGVMVDDGKVGGVFHTRRDQAGVWQTDTIRKQ